LTLFVTLLFSSPLEASKRDLRFLTVYSSVVVELRSTQWAILLASYILLALSGVGQLLERGRSLRPQSRRWAGNPYEIE
jgi:hypothetical protein